VGKLKRFAMFGVAFPLMIPGLFKQAYSPDIIPG
jgi:hypothetical protein